MIRSMSRSRKIASAALVVLLAAAVFVVLQARQAGALNDARAEALAAAKERIPALLSYEAATLDADLANALSQTTGSFHDDYGKVLSDVVKPTATERGISTNAAVNAAGVVRGNKDRVVVLLFLTQTTSSAKGEDGGEGGSAVTGSRVEVTMKRTGDDWKIAGLDPR